MSACPICKSAAPSPEESPHFPFCSRRCKLVDLGNWLGGTYRLDEEAPPVDLLTGERRRR